MNEICARCGAAIFKHGELTWVAPSQALPWQCGSTPGRWHAPAAPVNKPITCPACGGEGAVPTEREGDRPAVTCDMCGGAGWGILGPVDA